MSNVLWSNLAGFPGFISQRMDWGYFHLSVFASGMYLFNIIVISLANGRFNGHFVFGNPTLISALTNFPLLTLIYFAALLELMDMKFLFRRAMSILKKKDMLRN